MAKKKKRERRSPNIPPRLFVMKTWYTIRIVPTPNSPLLSGDEEMKKKAPERGINKMRYWATWFRWPRKEKGV
jgi:hypothetical protein